MPRKARPLFVVLVSRAPTVARGLVAVSLAAAWGGGPGGSPLPSHRWSWLGVRWPRRLLLVCARRCRASLFEGPAGSAFAASPAGSPGSAFGLAGLGPASLRSAGLRPVVCSCLANLWGWCCCVTPGVEGFFWV